MPCREPIARGVLSHFREAQRLLMLDQRAEHATPARQIADRALRVLVEPGGQELLELGALLVQDPERRVARAGDLPRRLQHRVENLAQIELGHELAPDVEEAAHPQFLGGGDGHLCRSLVLPKGLCGPQKGWRGRAAG